MKKVYDIMVRDIASIAYDTPIKEAAEKILKNNVGSLAVTDDGVTVGIVTDKDFVRYVSSGRNIENIGEIMSSPLIKIESSSDILETFRVMTENKISHVFVEEKKKIAGTEFVGVVGIVSLKDVLRYLPEYAQGV